MNYNVPSKYMSLAAKFKPDSKLLEWLCWETKTDCDKNAIYSIFDVHRMLCCLIEKHKLFYANPLVIDSILFSNEELLHYSKIEEFFFTQFEEIFPCKEDFNVKHFKGFEQYMVGVKIQKSRSGQVLYFPSWCRFESATVKLYNKKYGLAHEIVVRDNYKEISKKLQECMKTIKCKDTHLLQRFSELLQIFVGLAVSENWLIQDDLICCLNNPLSMLCNNEMDFITFDELVMLLLNEISAPTFLMDVRREE